MYSETTNKNDGIDASQECIPQNDYTKQLEIRCRDLEKAMNYYHTGKTLLSKFIQALDERNEFKQEAEFYRTKYYELKSQITPAETHNQ